ncbi:hypothetical protein AL486_19000 [Pandoraea apista]|nr:hypothetical protein AL486_19000 [Pandoraea apista]
MDASVYDAIKVFCADGDRLASAGDYKRAVAEYDKAWKLVPEPQYEWGASTWILTAIADACFLGGYITSARENLEYALICPGAPGNPFIHLRYGQVLYEQGELDSAADALMRAYMAAGGEIYADENPKYLAFLKTRAKL